MEHYNTSDNKSNSNYNRNRLGSCLPLTNLQGIDEGREDDQDHHYNVPRQLCRRFVLQKKASHLLNVVASGYLYCDSVSGVPVHKYANRSVRHRHERCCQHRAYLDGSIWFSMTTDRFTLLGLLGLPRLGTASGVNEPNAKTSATFSVHPSGFISVMLLLKKILDNLSYP